MIGRIDEGRRALIVIRIKSGAASSAKEMDAWIDTGFTGELVLHQDIIEELGLSHSGSVDGQLGDGSTAAMDKHECVIDWFGMERKIEAISSKVPIALLGAGLLQPRRLVADYGAKTLTIE